MKNIILITSIVLFIAINLFIRLWGLDKSPLSVGFDEASIGYNAYSIYLTGKDEYGTPYPLSLRSFNDFKPALYAYLSIPFIHFFDLSQNSIRAPSAVMGTISFIFLLLIFKQLSKKSWMESLIVIAVISFFPWRLHFSRVAFESNISMAFFTGMVWCLINFNKNTLFKLGTILFSAASIYSYHSSRLAVPLFLFFVIIDVFKFNFKKIINNPTKTIISLWPIFVVAILYLPLVLEANAGLLLTRLSQTNVFSHFYPFTPSELRFTQNIWLNVLAHPLYYLGGILSGHLLNYLSPKNLSLLIYPGVIKSAQVISGTGMLGFVGGFLFIVGLVTQFKSLVLEKRILIYWIIAGIIPAALTWEWFYPLRSLNIYPAIDIIVGLGIIFILKSLKKIKNTLFKFSVALGSLAVILMSSVYNTLNEYNFGAWETNGEFQPGGYKEGAPLLMSLMDKYDTIYIDSNQAQNYTIFWFYLKYPPQNVQKIAHLRNAPGVQGPATINFDKFIYKKYDWPNIKNENSFVFWTSSEVKEEEINNTPGAKMYRIEGTLRNFPVTIITKE